MAYVNLVCVMCLLFGFFTKTDSQQSDFANKFSQQLRDCHTSDRTALNTCLATVMRGLKPRLADGIPELDVPPLEPINLGNFGFNQTTGQVNIIAKFSNVLVNGFSQFHLDFVDSDSANQVLTVGVYITKLFVTGLYEIDGRVLALDLKGKGDLRAILIDIDALYESTIVLKTKPDGTERLGIANSKINFKLGETKAKLDKLFNNPLLAQTADLFIAQNHELILNEIRPGVSRDIAAFVESVMDAAFANIPIDVVFPNHPRA